MKQKIAPIALMALFLIGIASALTINSVVTSPEDIAPGQEFSLKIELENNLGDDATDIDVSLNLLNVPFAPVKSSEVSIDDLDDGDKEKASFDLIAQADAEAGTYKIPLNIVYKVDNQTKNKSSLVSVTVNAKPNLVLTSESSLIEGQKTKLDIKLTNTGLAKAKFLTVQIGSGNYDVLSAKSVYIGDLNSDDSDTASFDIFAKDTSVSIIPVTLTYRDSANNDYTESVFVSVKSYSEDEAVSLGLITKSNTKLYLGIIVLIIIVWLVYRSIRKRRMKR